MALNLSGHLWSAALLVSAATVALAVDRVASGSNGAARRRIDSAMYGDVARFMAPLRADSLILAAAPAVRVDPFRRSAVSVSSPVASVPGSPTVPATDARRLTAILIADDRRVAVIDERTVTVGDVLGDGSKVSAIQSDRVFVVEKNGQWRVLTLSSGRR
jgi:hypothetical protein